MTEITLDLDLTKIRAAIQDNSGASDKEVTVNYLIGVIKKLDTDYRSIKARDDAVKLVLPDETIAVESIK